MQRAEYVCGNYLLEKQVQRGVSVELYDDPGGMAQQGAEHLI
jgi:hypothetical protein